MAALEETTEGEHLLLLLIFGKRGKERTLHSLFTSFPNLRSLFSLQVFTMPSVTEWITAIDSVVVAVMAILTYLRRSPAPSSPPADPSLARHALLADKTAVLEDRLRLQGDWIEAPEQRLNDPPVMTQAFALVTNEGWLR